MAHEGDEDDAGTHCNEDYSDLRQAVSCKGTHGLVSGVLLCSDNDETNPRCLKNKLNNRTLMQLCALYSNIATADFSLTKT